MKHELVRKAVHALLAVLFMFLGVVADGWMLVMGVGVLGALFAYARSWRATRVFHAVPRISYGEFYFLAGVAVAAYMFLPEHSGAWVAGMLILAFADPLAALIGRRFGRHRYRILGEARSLEGSCACYVTSALVFVGLGAPAPYAIAAGVVLATAEALAPRGSDNLLLPTVGGFLALYLI